MNAFAWLNDLMAWLGRWVPRIILVRASHEGVRFGMGGAVVRLSPGVHVYWPIVQEVQLVSLALRSLETSAQVVDNYATSVVVLYRFTNAVSVARDYYNAAAQLDMRVKAHIAQCGSRGDLTPILVPLQREFEPLGIAIESIATTQRSWCLAVKKLDDWGIHEERTLQ
jgi:hypothetical protein